MFLCPWDFPGKNIGVGCHLFPQGKFSIQGSNPHLLHCRQILYHWATWEALSSPIWKSCFGKILLLLRCSVRSDSATPWAVACQASLSFTVPPSLLKLTSIELIYHPTISSCCPLLLLSSIFPSIRVFTESQLFTSGGQSIGVSASASVLPMNI